jgi:hypothetical protein
MYHSGQLPMSNGLYENQLYRARWWLFDPETRTYLHMSGTGTTRDATWAWSGTIAQARSLQTFYAESGAPFPFRMRHPVTGDMFEVAL